MERKIKEVTDFLLKWGEHKLFGWQHFTGIKGVFGFVLAIEKGYKMPAVDIVKRGDFYYLCGDRDKSKGCFQYGGHYRAIAHYIAGKSLNCNLWKEDNDPLLDKRRFRLIENSVLSDRVPAGNYIYYDLLKEKDAREIAEELGDDIPWGTRFLDSA